MDVDARALTCAGMEMFRVSEMAKMDLSCLELAQTVLTSMITMQPGLDKCTTAVFAASFGGWVGLSCSE